MSIVTKQGDKGRTSFYLGKKIYKDAFRIEANGVLDELSCWLGLAKSVIKSKKDREIILAIQEDLYNIASEIATSKKYLHKLKYRIDKKAIERLEKYIREFEVSLTLKHKFVYPGDTIQAAILDISRSVARKLERRLVSLKRKKMLNNNSLLIYCNRLSDFIFLMARKYDKKKLRHGYF